MARRDLRAEVHAGERPAVGAPGLLLLLALPLLVPACSGGGGRAGADGPGGGDVSADHAGGKADGPGDGGGGVHVPDVDATAYGRYLVVESFPAPQLGQPHKVVVYLPEAYEAEPAERFPVLYLHDGQNLFADEDASFGREWGVDETVDALTAHGTIDPLIVVGVWNTADRVDEYTPSWDATVEGGGDAAAYGAFLVEEVKPWVDATLRTRPDRAHTGLAGSSLGGLVSFWLRAQYPDVFGRVACVSSSFWWNGGEARGWVPAVLASWHDGDRIWFDAGTAEGNDSGTDEGDATDPDGNGVPYMVDDSRAVRDGLLAGGLTFGEDLGFLEDRGAQHNEAAWARRLPAILAFLWGDRPLPAPRSLRLWPYDSHVLVGERTSVAVTLRYTDDLDLTPPASFVDFGSEDPGIAVVDTAGVVTGTGVGSATVTADFAGLHDELPLAVQTEESDVVVAFEVIVPASTPEGDVVHLSGDLAELGGWEPPGWPLRENEYGHWTGALVLPKGTHLEYKVTRGSWETVEKDADGAEVANREHTAERDSLTAVEVLRWADQ